MKTLYVGGRHFFNRFSNLEAAVERAESEDIIELEKDIFDVSVTITKNITINGNGHIIKPPERKTAFDCTSFVIFNDIEFKCGPRSNAILVRNGGLLNHVKTTITHPVIALYPTIVQRGGTLTVEDSEITFMETYKSHGTKPNTVTIFNNSVLNDCYDGSAWLDNTDRGLSHFRGTTGILESVITSALLEGHCTITDTVLKNFNKVTGNVRMTRCELSSSKIHKNICDGEPVNGPLKDLRADIVPYALHIAGGTVKIENHMSDIEQGCLGFYMTAGTLDICHTKANDRNGRHLIKGGSVTFTDVYDNGRYKIKNACFRSMGSKINTVSKTKSAMEELNDMIGLGTVKKQLRTIVNTINVNMKCPEKDFGFSHHMIFAGDPGTGKTTVAKLAAKALFEIGSIPEDKCMEIPASQLIKGFVGQTGEHVESVMKNALGGVLFIDEAYELMVKDNQNTFNNDAISVLIRYMEEHRDNLIVIAAGYEKEMREFLASNVGLTRRFQWVTFDDYTADEMVEIFFSMMDKHKETFAFANENSLINDCLTNLTDYYLTHPDTKGRITNGGNGGLVRNLFQQIIFARNNRVADNPESTMKIIYEDVIVGFHEEFEKAVHIYEA